MTPNFGPKRSETFIMLLQNKKAEINNLLTQMNTAAKNIEEQIPTLTAFAPPGEITFEEVQISDLPMLEDFNDADRSLIEQVNTSIHQINDTTTKENKMNMMKRALTMINISYPKWRKNASEDIKPLLDSKRDQIQAAMAVLEGRMGGKLRRKHGKTHRKSVKGKKSRKIKKSVKSKKSVKGKKSRKSRK